MAFDKPAIEEPEPTQATEQVPTDTAPELSGSPSKRTYLSMSKILVGMTLLGLVICGVGVWFIWQSYRADTHTSSLNSIDPYATSYSYLTYRSSGKASTFYVGTPSGKVIVHTPLPSAANDSYVYARNNAGLILENTSQSNIYAGHSNSSYIYVGFDGSTKLLSPAVATTLTDGLNNAVLDGTTMVVYSACNNNTSQCTLNSIDLNTGAITTYLTERGINTCCSVADPISILGASGNKIYYTHANSFAAPNELDVYNMATKKAVQTYKLQANPQFPPVLSNNNQYAVYDDGQGSSTTAQITVYILDLLSGHTTSFSVKNQGGVVASYQNAFWWSPDDSSIEFTSPLVAPSSSTPPMSINLYTLSTRHVSTVIAFGDPRYNFATVMGWLSNDELFYSIDRTTYANDFAPPYDGMGSVYAAINAKTGEDIPNPVDLKYTIVTPEPKL